MYNNLNSVVVSQKVSVLFIKMIGLRHFLQQKGPCTHQISSNFVQFCPFLTHFNTFYINFGYPRPREVHFGPFLIPLQSSPARTESHLVKKAEIFLG